MEIDSHGRDAEGAARNDASVTTRVLACRRPSCWRRVVPVGGADRPRRRSDHRSARRPEAGPARRRRRPRATWSCVATLPQARRASSIRRRPRASPTAHAGRRRRRRTPNRGSRGRNAGQHERQPPRSRRQPAAAASGRGGGLDFANSDLAFSGNHLFIGNFNGFNIYDIENPRKPQLLASVVCPGGQGDVSVLRQPAVHVGRADARPPRLRHAGRRRHR